MFQYNKFKVMGFDGSGSMNLVLKNNRNLLNDVKREKFKNSLGSYDERV